MNQPLFPAQRILESVAQATALREGPQGVAMVLWNLLQARRMPLRDLAQRVGLPIPVLSAVRRELERAGVLDREAGARLTPTGKALAKELWGVEELPALLCETCLGRGLVPPDLVDDLTQEFTDICKQRPPVDTALDQAHATPGTGLLRACVLLRSGALLGGRVLFLGDDDLSCLAFAMLAQRLGGGERFAATVLDIDPRYLELIDSEASRRGWRIETHALDYREPLPAAMHGAFGAVVTDPPYTLDGLDAVLARSAQAADPEHGAALLLSYPPRSAQEWLRCQGLMQRHGVVVQETHPHANVYTGNSMHAHVSHLHVGRIVTPRQQAATGPSSGFYTATRMRK